MDAVAAEMTIGPVGEGAPTGLDPDPAFVGHRLLHGGVRAVQADPVVNDVVVEVLRHLLVTAEREGLELNAIDGGRAIGLVVEYAGVRLALLVDAACESHGLSPREMQIARMVADGATNRAIGSTLEISLWTVSTHLRRVFAKLGVNSRAEMVSQLFGTPHLPP